MYFDKDQPNSYRNNKKEKRPPHEHNSPEHHSDQQQHPNGSSGHSHGSRDSQHSHSDRGNGHPSDRSHMNERGHPSDRGHTSDRGHPNARTHPSERSHHTERGRPNDRGHSSRGYPKAYKERNRNYKSSRDKYSSRDNYCKDKPSDRNHCFKQGDFVKKNCPEVASTSTRSSKPKESSSLAKDPLTEWSSHISSTGKRYYYNAISEVSQWERPTGWRQGLNRNIFQRPNACRREAEIFNPKYRPDWRSSRDEHDQKRPIHLVPYEDNSPYLSPDKLKPTDKYMAQASTSKSSEKPGPSNEGSDIQNISLLAAALPKICQAPETVTSVSVSRNDGPPTPTHFESTDQVTHLDTALPRKMESFGNFSLQPAPMLTPSLVNYVRNDLTSHVTGWPSELLEQEANRYAKEAYTNFLQFTRESAELKCVRAVVRHRDLQATLQEQRLIYIREQIAKLESSRPNNVMVTDD